VFLGIFFQFVKNGRVKSVGAGNTKR